MTARQINIDPKEKAINIFVDDITISQIKELVKHFVGMDDYEILIHNPKQSTDLIAIYEGNVIVDNLYEIR
mgnify:CR=1 FL=1|jgi:hypothetical protein